MKYILDNSNSMIFWKRQNYGDKINSDCHGLGVEVMYKQSTEDFKGTEKPLYDTITMDACFYTFVQIHNIYNANN